MSKVNGSSGYKKNNMYEGQAIQYKTSGKNTSNRDEMGEKAPIVVSEASIILMEMFLRDQVLAQ